MLGLTVKGHRVVVVFVVVVVTMVPVISCQLRQCD